MTTTTSMLPGLAQPICLRQPALRPLCVRAAGTRAILSAMARRVPVDLILPDGELLGGGSRSPGRPAIEILRPTEMFERLAHQPKIGVGEAYMAGDWRPAPGTDLAEAMLPFAQQIRSLLPAWLHRMRWVVDRRPPGMFRNTLQGARRNIEAHYDLSNEMFASFLDETLTYSSARFDPAVPWSAQTLESAQLRKIAAVLDAADVGPGSRVLEIGTGWGTLAIEAARRGAHVVTLTLSVEQASLAADRAREAGVADLVDIRVQDYREVDGSYDAVVSVEMIEAVGEDYWPTYFSTIEERLAPGGIAAVQAILMDHDRFLATRRSYGWINKHIFPGGIIPSLEAIEQVTTRHTGLQVTRVEQFGADYAETLRRWRERFIAQWEQVESMGFDQTFQRRWEFYLAYCEAGFDGGAIDVGLLRLERG